MYIGGFFVALFKDWVARMSGIGSVALAFWVTYFPPAPPVSRTLLWLLVFICLLITSYRLWLAARKNAWAEIEGLRSELERAVTKPLFEGAIESQQAAPIHTMSGGLEGYHSGCGIFITARFANNRPTRTTVVKLRLRLKIGEATFDADLTPERGPYRLLFPGTYDNEPLTKRLGVVAEQGELFKGYLQFTLPDVLIKDSDEVRVEALLIEDTCAQVHEIKPGGDGLVVLHPRLNQHKEYLRSRGNAPPMLADLVPSLIMEPIEISSELTSLLEELFPRLPGYGRTSDQSQGQKNPS
jgi:hypothetical protein